MESWARARLISVGVLVLVLATGFVLGLAWDRRPGGPLADEARTEARERDRDRRESDGRKEDDDRRGRRLIVDRVGLAPAQEAKVDSIVAIHRHRLDELQREFRSEYGPRHRQLVQRTRDAIRSVLTPEQRTHYDSLLARYDRKEAAESARKRDRDEGDDRRRDDRKERDGP